MTTSRHFSEDVIEEAIELNPALFGLIGDRGITPGHLEGYLSRDPGPSQDRHILMVLAMGAMQGRQDEAVRVLDRVIPYWRVMFTAMAYQHGR